LLLKAVCHDEEIIIELDIPPSLAKKYLQSGSSIEGWVIGCGVDHCAFRWDRECLLDKFYDGSCFIETLSEG